MKEKFVTTNEWDSHRELLFVALENTKGLVLEFGCGEGSTPLIREYCKKHGRKFISLETNKEYAERFDAELVEGYGLNVPDDDVGLVFIDCAPAEERKKLIDIFRFYAEVIVVHDSEEKADYVYGMKDIFQSFKHRVDYKPEGLPHTTAVSNFIDISKWKI